MTASLLRRPLRWFRDVKVISATPESRPAMTHELVFKDQLAAAGGDVGLVAWVTSLRKSTSRTSRSQILPVLGDSDG